MTSPTDQAHTNHGGSMTKMFCDRCGVELGCQYWTKHDLDLCRPCYERECLAEQLMVALAED